MGYCPIVLQKERILYCNTFIVLQRRRLERWKLYCNTEDCIARMCSWLGRKVYCKRVLYCNRGRRWHREQCIAIHCTVLWLEGLQEARLYRNTTWSIVTWEQRQGWTVLRYSAQPSHDTARRRAGAGRARQADAEQARGRRRARCRWEALAHGRQAHGERQVRGVRQAPGAHGRAEQAGHGRLGGLGAAWVCSWANGQCTWCT